MCDAPTPLTPNERALTQQVVLLQAQVVELKALVVQLTDEIARLKRNSSNSNKPPSSDFSMLPKPSPPDGRKPPRLAGAGVDTLAKLIETGRSCV